MSEKEKRMHRCCFTGHRPEKLLESEAEVVVRLRSAIQRAIDDGFKTFISGMARGVDIWAAEVVLAFRKTNQDIHLICAIPHPDFEKWWSAEWQERYNAVRRQADYEVTICEASSKSAYQRRNEWLVDHSARVIAVYNGTKGGTRNTIEYANKKGIEVYYIKEWDVV